jgi:hypothetical protein
VEFNYRIKGMKNVNGQVRFNACSAVHVSYTTRRERRNSATVFSSSINNNGIYQKVAKLIGRKLI